MRKGFNAHPYYTSSFHTKRSSGEQCMKNLFDHWQSIERQIKNAEKVFILSDYDGTLTPIVKKPDLATLSEEMKQLLQSIAKNPHYTFAIISGRSIEDVKKLAGLDGIYYAGNHGLEIDGPNIYLIHPEAARISPAMNLIRKELQKEIGHIDGLIIEDKHLTLSVHYRLVKRENIDVVKRVTKGITEKYAEVKVTGGKKVFEIMPKIAWGKGAASLWIIKSIANNNTLAVYLGDDETDEDAFASLKDGITILVSAGKSSSKAKYFVRNTVEVQKFLNNLVRN